MLDFSIITVAYHSSQDLAQLLPTVEPSARPFTWHLTIVDNTPTGNGPVLSLQELQNAVTMIRSPANVGYSGGFNLGIEKSPPARNFLLVNPDLTFEPEAIHILGRELDGGSSAAVTLILDPDGARALSLRREPTLLSALADALLGDSFRERSGWLSETVRDPAAYERPHDVDWATGAVLAVRADVVEQVGQWDSSSFFLYSEETDYSRRIRACGGRIRFVPEAVVRHRGAGSGTSASLEALREVNKLRYFEKWHSGAIVPLFAFVRILHNSIRPHRPGARAALRALLFQAERENLPGPRIAV